ARLPALLLMLAWLGALSIGPTGCVEGGGSSDDPGPSHEDLTAVSQIDQADRIYFLKRTHFAFRTSELQTLNQIGYGPYIDQMLEMQSDPTLEAQALAETVPDPDYPSQTELSRWWIWLMANNPNAFQERLALFWHDHFAASNSVLDAQSLWWYFNHINMWRTQGTSNLRSEERRVGKE